MLRRLLTFLLLALLVSTLVACQLGSPSVPTTESSPAATSGVSGEGTAPSEVSPGPFTVPTPTDDSKASLGGTLLQLEDGEPQGPLSSGVIYLGTILYDENGTKQAAVMDDINSPHTTVDEQGNFVFENLDPGEYALFFWTPMGSVMLKHPETGRDMLFDVKAGEAINVGTLSYNISVVAP